MVFCMGKNRDRLGIVAAILESANSGATKTHIMFQANLSFSLLEKYLDVACTAGFVQNGTGRYQLTELGREFLKEYRHFYERYDRALRTLESLSSERERLDHLCNRYRLDASIEPDLSIE
jgi:predicted transcriptional regulator